MAKEDSLLPKKSGPADRSPSGGGAPGARRLSRIVRLAGLFSGGAVTLVFAMSVVGVVTDVFWARLGVGLLLVIGLPLLLSDRLRRRRIGRAGALDASAIVLLGVALLLVAADFASRPLLVREGDRYARSGSRTTARVVYFLAGVKPTFPDEQPAAPAPSASAAPAPSASAAPAAPSGAVK